MRTNWKPLRQKLISPRILNKWVRERERGGQARQERGEEKLESCDDNRHTALPLVTACLAGCLAWFVKKHTTTFSIPDHRQLPAACGVRPEQCCYIFPPQISLCPLSSIQYNNSLKAVKLFLPQQRLNFSSIEIET